jgi:hypothetical protein
MPATRKITHPTNGCLEATLAAKCWQATCVIWRGLDPVIEEVGTRRCPTNGSIAKAMELEERHQLMFSAGF